VYKKSVYSEKKIKTYYDSKHWSVAISLDFTMHTHPGAHSFLVGI